MTPLEPLKTLIRTALAEDIGTGDVTSALLIPEPLQAKMAFTAREEMVVCGLDVPSLVYAELSDQVKVEAKVKEGEKVPKGTVIAIVSGPARPILTGERVSLNIMQRMCGIATITRRYVEAVEGTGTKILDTRKTMPGMRELDKYAVRVGGGENHRMRLADMVLIKDNHIAIAGDVKKAVELAKQHSKVPVVVECDTLQQVQQAMLAGPDRIMLDNMPVDVLKQAVALAGGKIPLEATGGITLATIRAVALTGVDYISTGAITHSVPAVDIGLDAL